MHLTLVLFLLAAQATFHLASREVLTAQLYALLISKVPIANPCKKPWFLHWQILAKVHLQILAKTCESLRNHSMINCESLQTWTLLFCETIVVNLLESSRKHEKAYLWKLAKPKYFCESIFAIACKRQLPLLCLPQMLNYPGMPTNHWRNTVQLLHSCFKSIRSCLIYLT